MKYLASITIVAALLVSISNLTLADDAKLQILRSCNAQTKGMSADQRKSFLVKCLWKSEPSASQNQSQSSYPQNSGASGIRRSVGGISNAYGLSNVTGSVKTMNECVVISDDEVKNRTAGSVHGGVMGSGADSARNGGRSWYVIQNVCDVQVRISWCFLGTDSDEIHPDACAGWGSGGLGSDHVFSPGEKTGAFHEGRHNGILYLASRMKSPTGEYMWCELTQRSIPVRRNAKVCCGVQGHNSCPIQKQIVYTREMALRRWVPE